ncbi:hypothetical protein [Sorangium cellulosum]|uniref:Threonine dehydratase n=1 Tax=Sorangium cellulosum TaxID=56 RepID=A0A150QFN0_SORCE|nr:hypothetical protein [Sorangium cellulosum]KYF66478.1 hypothetical protein BE15_26575 [Sorangium cellulosum]
MKDHATHQNHAHDHGTTCGHPAIRHGDHVDYLHDGHLHHQHEDHFDEHVLSVDDANPAQCTPSHACSGHDVKHKHGQGCGHPPVPHGDHVDFLVEGHLHHPHSGHCDHHGDVQVMA